MTIYVDNMRGDAQVQRRGRTVTGQWSHLLADDSGELAAFAANLGLRPEWVQAPGTPGEHYDVVEAVRRRAVAAGAVPISYPRGTGNLIATKRMQAAALDAASRRWHVFPLRPGTKVPAVRHWEDEATTDNEQIKELWTAQPRRRDEWHIPEPRNVGIACGPSMLVVVDLDVEKPGQDRTSWPKRWLEHDIASGAEALAVVADLAFQTVPATYTVSTPSGGRHLYFDAPASAVIRNSAGHPGPMIDVRGVGGYVVAAGSRLHPSRGQDDQVAGPGERAYRLIDDRPAADLPGWLTATIANEQRWDDHPAARGPAVNDTRHRVPHGRSEGYGAAALRGEGDRVRSAPVGQRNHILNAAAYSLGQLVAAGALDRDRVVEALTDAAASTGLEPAEVAATVASGLTAGAKNPRTVEPPKGFPATVDGAARSRRQAEAGEPGTPAPTPPGPTRDIPGRPVFDAATFDRAVALAIESAVSVVDRAAPDRRVDALREAAARIGRLVEVDGVDGPSALDALAGAAAQVGMPPDEIEATIAAGVAQRWPTPTDDRPSPVMTGSVVAEMAAQRKQAELDAAKPHRERDTSEGKQLRSEAEQSPHAGTGQVAGADLGPGREAPDPPYRIAEVDAAHAGWLFAEAWHSFSNDRRPCYPADTLRLACEWEGLPTLGKEDRRFGPRSPAPSVEAPGDKLVHRDVWESWTQAQCDEWHFARQQRVDAAARRLDDPRSGRAPAEKEPARGGAGPAAPETTDVEPAAGQSPDDLGGAGRPGPAVHDQAATAGSALDQPVDSDALLRALLEVLQTRGVIDRTAWDDTVTAVATRPAADPDRPAEHTATTGRSGPNHAEPDPAVPGPIKKTDPAMTRDDPQSADPVPVPPVEVAPAAPDAHAGLDRAIGHARAAVDRAETARAARRSDRSHPVEAAVPPERLEFWAGPEVAL